MRHILIAAAIALAAAATPAAASEGFAGQILAGQTFAGTPALDKLETTYVRHTREHRLWEIQRTQELQQRRAYRDGYRDRGPRYDRDYGPPRDRGYRRDRYDRY